MSPTSRANGPQLSCSMGAWSSLGDSSYLRYPCDSNNNGSRPHTVISTGTGTPLDSAGRSETAEAGSADAVNSQLSAQILREVVPISARATGTGAQQSPDYPLTSQASLTLSSLRLMPRPDTLI